MATLNGIFEGLIEPERGGFSAELAQYVLGLKFSEAQVARYESLADRNQEGTLSPEERSELEGFVTVNNFLMIMKLKARHSLMEHSPAA
jgi:hypothetical protein